METQPSPLADQLAGLRATITSNDGRGWLPASLHALIATIFARIFDRLEQLFQLWQSGQLPAPQPSPPRQTQRRPSHPDSARTSAAPPRTSRHMADPSGPAPSRPIQQSCARTLPPPLLQSPTTTSSARPRRRPCASRAPPPETGTRRALHHRGYFITISK